MNPAKDDFIEAGKSPKKDPVPPAHSGSSVSTCIYLSHVCLHYLAHTDAAGVWISEPLEQNGAGIARNCIMYALPQILLE
jgi:hypothetical protein